jgi:hypothetical protein
MANKAVEKASTGIHAIQTGILATFVTVPEFGSNHVFTIAQLDTLASGHEEQHQWAKESPELAAFRDRMSAYRKSLTELLALKEQWHKENGLRDLQAEQWVAINLGARAWKDIVSRLKAGRDVAAIARYLGRPGNQIPPYDLQEAFSAIASGRRK